MKSRRTLLAASVIALSGLAAAACSSSSSSSTPTASSSSTAATSGSSVNLSSVTLNVGDQKGTGAEAVLKAAGLLSTLPFKVSWSDFTSGPPMLEAMASGSVDVGGVGDAPPVFAASGGEQVEIVGARSVPSGDQDALVVPKGSSITSIQQLKGKKIAYGSGSSANYHLLTVLNKAGLTTKDVTLVHAGGSRRDHVRRGRRLGHLAAVRAAGRRAERREGARDGLQYGSPYCSSRVKAAVASSEKAAAIKVYLATLNKAYVFTATHPDVWGAAWGAASGLPASITTEAAKVDVTTPVTITSAVISSEQNLVSQFYKAGLIPNNVDMSGFITSEFNSTVSESG
jgi:sulfonate transport system substrate-binding protein